MKIEREDRKKCVTFKEVRRGDFFEWDDVIYLKICDDSFNAYNCIEDTITTFSDKVKVNLLNAKVVIE